MDRETEIPYVKNVNMHEVRPQGASLMYVYFSGRSSLGHGDAKERQDFC